MTTTAPTDATPTDAPLEDLAQRLDDIARRTADLTPEARRLIGEHLDAARDLNALGLRTIVRSLRDDPRGKELLFELVDDPAVRMLLATHGIIRADPMTAARSVLERVRPGIAEHGGDVELVSIDDGVAFIRLLGACNGCSMASVTMRETVESALVEGVPGLRSVEVVPNEPAPAFVPLTALSRRPDDADRTESTASLERATRELREAGWTRICRVEDVGRDTVVTGAVGTGGRDLPVLVVGVGSAAAAGGASPAMRAYVNACAHEGRPLDDALVDPSDGTLTCPWHGLTYDCDSGECLTSPGAQLEPLPSRVEGGAVWVRAGDRP